MGERIGRGDADEVADQAMVIASRGVDPREHREAAAAALHDGGIVGSGRTLLP